MIFKNFEIFLSPKRRFEVKFRLVSLMAMAIKRVKILEMVASIMLVKKDFIKSGSENIFPKLALMPSITIAIKGVIKKSANSMITET